MWDRVFSIASLAMAALFASFAALQYNDPDPARWIAVYGAAAVVSVLAGRRAFASWVLPAAVGGVALAWAAIWTTSIFGQAVELREVFSVSRMIDERVEEAREALGLLMVAAWMGVTTRRALRMRRRP